MTLFAMAVCTASSTTSALAQASGDDVKAAAWRCTEIGVENKARIESCTMAITSGQFTGSYLAELHNWRALAYDSDKQFALAIADWDRVSEIDPNYDIIHIRYRGDARRSMKDREGAIRDMRLYLEKFYQVKRPEFFQDVNADQARQALVQMGVKPPAPPPDLSPAACKQLDGRQVTVSGAVFHKQEGFLEFFEDVRFLDAKTGCRMAYQVDGRSGCSEGDTITVTGRVKYNRNDRLYQVYPPKGAKPKCRRAR